MSSACYRGPVEDDRGSVEDASASLGPDPKRGGLGLDLVSIPRMARLLERRPEFAERYFSPSERELNARFPGAAGFAMGLAAKEALLKKLYWICLVEFC